MIDIYKKIIKRYSDLFINFFLLGASIYTFVYLYQYSYILNITGSIKSILRLLAFLLIVPRIAFQNYDRKTIIFSLFVVILTCLCIALGGDKSLLLIPMILIGIKDIEIYKIVKIIFVITLSCVILHCIVFMVSYVIENNSFISMFHISSSPVKNKIMFYDNNMWGIRFTCCVMQYMYLTDRNNHRFLKAGILGLLSIFMLLISQSRASFIICVLLVIYMLIENVAIFNKRIIVLRNTSIIFSFIVSILLVVIPEFSNPVFTRIISYLSGRPTIYNKAFNYIGVNLLPSIEKFTSMSKVFGSYMLPDNSYISVFLKWGLILSLTMFILTFVFINKTKNEPIIDYLIAVIAIWLIVEFISMEFVMYFVPLVIFNSFLKSDAHNKN